MRARTVIALAAVLLGGCHVGSRQENSRPARTPFGATMVIDFRTRAELLVATDSGFLVRLGTGRVAFARFSQMRSVSFEQLDGTYYWWRDRLRDPGYVARVRLVARYPQGLLPEQLAELLRLSGQTEPASLP